MTMREPYAGPSCAGCVLLGLVVGFTVGAILCL